MSINMIVRPVSGNGSGLLSSSRGRFGTVSSGKGVLTRSRGGSHLSSMRGTINNVTRKGVSTRRNLYRPVTLNNVGIRTNVNRNLGRRLNILA